METTERKPEQQPNALRRKLFRGVPAGVGVLMAVQARTALATGVCISPSAMLSGNTSHQHDSSGCSGGRSPGFWVQPQKFSYWRNATPPIFIPDVVPCTTSGVSDLKASDISDQGTPINAIFRGGFSIPNLSSGPVGVWYALAFPTDTVFVSTVRGQLARHLAAAYLNVGLFGSAYPITTDQIAEMWEKTSVGGRYCPASGCGPDGGWSAQQVIDYIAQMFDINADVGPPPCKKK